MKSFGRLQSLAVFWKRVIVVCVIITLAVPSIFLIGSSFKKRAEEFEKENLFKEGDLEEIKEIGDVLEANINNIKEAVEQATSTDEE